MTFNATADVENLSPGLQAVKFSKINKLRSPLAQQSEKIINARSINELPGQIVKTNERLSKRFSSHALKERQLEHSSDDQRKIIPLPFTTRKHSISPLVFDRSRIGTISSTNKQWLNQRQNTISSSILQKNSIKEVVTKITKNEDLCSNETSQGNFLKKTLEVNDAKSTISPRPIYKSPIKQKQNKTKETPPLVSQLPRNRGKTNGSKTQRKSPLCKSKVSSSQTSHQTVTKSSNWDSKREELTVMKSSCNSVCLKPKLVVKSSPTPKRNKHPSSKAMAGHSTSKPHESLKISPPVPTKPKSSPLRKRAIGKIEAPPRCKDVKRMGTEKLSRKEAQKVQLSRSCKHQSTFDRLNRSSTVASNNLKWNYSKLSSTEGRSTNSILSHSSTFNDSVFDRLSKASTVATSSMKWVSKTPSLCQSLSSKPCVIDNSTINHKIIHGKVKSKTLMKKKQATKNGSGQKFESQGESNIKMRQRVIKNESKEINTRQYRKQINHNPVPPPQPCSHKRPSSITISTSFRVFCNSKNPPEQDLTELDMNSLGLSGSLAVYEIGKFLTGKEISTEIISSLFCKDLSEDEKWMQCYPETKELDDSEEEFFVKIKALYKDKEASKDKIGEIRTATGNVTIITEKKQIHVENYCVSTNLGQSEL